MADDDKKPAAEHSADSGKGTESGQRGRGGRGRFPGKGNAPAIKTPFEGRCDDLKNHIYDCANTAKAADMYTKTTREIIEYIGRTIKYSADLVKGMESLVEPMIEEPDDLPENASALH
jgi:hypothetical protein